MLGHVLFSWSELMKTACPAGQTIPESPNFNFISELTSREHQGEYGEYKSQVCSICRQTWVCQERYKILGQWLFEADYFKGMASLCFNPTRCCVYSGVASTHSAQTPSVRGWDMSTGNDCDHPKSKKGLPPSQSLGKYPVVTELPKNSNWN